MLTGRYYFGDSDQSFPFAQLGGGLLPGFNTVTPTRVQLVSLSWVRVMNASQVNEARLGWNRFAEGFFPEDKGFEPSSIGLNTGASGYDSGLPAITMGGFSQIGATTSVPRNRVDTNWHFVDNYSWKTGRHDVKLGYEFRRTSILHVIDHNFRGTLDFADLNDFLLGIPDGGSQITGFTRRHTAENSHGFYLQDSFRWTPRLTLNLGVRWDYFGVVHEKNNLFWGFDPANGGSLLQVGSSGGPSKLYNPDYNNFAPRLAFASSWGTCPGIASSVQARPIPDQRCCWAAPIRPRWTRRQAQPCTVASVKTPISSAPTTTCALPTCKISI
jgi:outer membrane receptor protein involved in Fe transport